MSRRLRSGLLLLATALVAGACATSPAATTSPAAASPTATASPSPSPTQSPSPAAGATSPGIALPSFNADPQLAAQLPSEVRGTQLQKVSFAGAQFLTGNDENSREFRDTLTRLGKSPADVTVAAAADPASALKVQIVAFKVAGADANRVLQELLASARRESTAGVDVAQTTIGGKSVTTMLDKDETDEGLAYLYPKGDTVFFVQSPDRALAEEAVSKLP